MNTLRANPAGSSAVDAVMGEHPGQEPIWGSTRRTVFLGCVEVRALVSSLTADVSTRCGHTPCDFL